MMYYNADVYGRSNSIELGYRNKFMFGCTVSANTISEARQKAWELYLKHKTKESMTTNRNRVRIEIERANENNSLALMLGKALLPRR